MYKTQNLIHSDLFIEFLGEMFLLSQNAIIRFCGFFTLLRNYEKNGIRKSDQLAPGNVNPACDFLHFDNYSS